MVFHMLGVISIAAISKQTDRDRITILQSLHSPMKLQHMNQQIKTSFALNTQLESLASTVIRSVNSLK